MNSIDYRKTYSEHLKTFLETPAGQHYLGTLGAMRPQHEFSQQNHLLIENRGAIRGYEIAMKNIITLATAYSISQEAEPNYGVPNKISQPQ